MKKVVLTFGLIAGAFCSAMMLVTIPLANRASFNRAEYLGYTTIVLAFLLVFFGVRSYRDNTLNGSITFGRAFAVGLAITLVACACYVVTWEILYYTVYPDFMDNYAAHMIEKARHSGASAAALQTQLQGIERTKQLYRNPLYNAALTFLEPFPVGLLVTLISAVALRRKQSPAPAAPALATSF